MPIGIDEKTGKQAAFCDWCLTFCHLTDPTWLHDYGFDVGKPKINIECRECFIGCLKGGIPVRGFGIVTTAQQEEIKEKSKKRVRTKANAEDLATQVDWEALELSIKNGECKVSGLAETWNANPAEVRKLIEDRFGDKVVFKRGRNGGVFWNE